MAWGENNKGPWGNIPNNSKKPVNPASLSGGNNNEKPQNSNGSSGSGGGNDFNKIFNIKPNNSGEIIINLRTLIILIILALVGWASTGIYKVDATEVGVVLRFGKFDRYASEGLRYHLPNPIEKVIIVKRTIINTIEVGFRKTNQGNTRFFGYNDENSDNANISSESLMITGDTNIADVSFAVQWRIKEPKDFLFEIDNPEQTIKLVAESAMREVIGKSLFAEAMTTKRAQIESEVSKIIQEILDSYNSGVEIYAVNLNDVQNPAPVMPAFLDVETAKQDRETAINKAKSYENDIVPKARGEARKIIQDAEAYKEQVISIAKGEAARFVSVYNEYAKAKDVTKRRMYLETMQQILTGTDKMIVDNSAGVLPYLPVNEIRKKK
ncbi:MAG: FtsH protease activity modulator HflK [Rickettsiales bacterium]|nr:FtsH protease activity modulator HflK [Rickettsiales bacterium]